jgi:uncharacterized protein involved in exopolysaccharide biosynthesis
MISEKTGFWDYIALLVKWRRLIVVNFVIICAIAIIMSFVLPEWYKAETILFPPTEQSMMPFGLSSVLGDIPFTDIGLPGMTSPSEIFIGILQSQSVARTIVEKYDLQRVYKKDRLISTIETLWDHSEFEITEEGLIYVAVEERDPQLAAAIANTYVEELDRVNQQADISQAKSTRIFVATRLEETVRKLQEAEEALRRFQEEHRTISLPEQVAAIIESAVELRTNQVTLEVERGVLSGTLSPSHPRMLQLQKEIDEIQKQLDEIMRGEGEQDGSTDEDFSIPLADVPSVGLKLARLTREVMIQEAIFELLTQQHEQAKIQEAKDTPTVQILDRAVPPERRSRPVRRRMVLLAGMFSLFLSMVMIAWIEYVNRLKDQEREKYTLMRESYAVLRKDLLAGLKKVGIKRSGGSSSS